MNRSDLIRERQTELGSLMARRYRAFCSSIAGPGNGPLPFGSEPSFSDSASGRQEAQTGCRSGLTGMNARSDDPS
jgi:hypothetical protein